MQIHALRRLAECVAALRTSNGGAVRVTENQVPPLPLSERTYVGAITSTPERCAHPTACASPARACRRGTSHPCSHSGDSQSTCLRFDLQIAAATVELARMGLYTEPTCAQAFLTFLTLATGVGTGHP